MDGGLNRIVDYNVAGLTLKGGSQEDPRGHRRAEKAAIKVSRNEAKNRRS